MPGCRGSMSHPKFVSARLICHSMKPEDLISRQIETLEGMLREEFIALPLEANLAVINGYKMSGHALQQLEMGEIYTYSGRQFLEAYTTAEAVCKDSAAALALCAACSGIVDRIAGEKQILQARRKIKRCALQGRRKAER